jgi:hypothetical protein
MLKIVDFAVKDLMSLRASKKDFNVTRKYIL